MANAIYVGHLTDKQGNVLGNRTIKLTANNSTVELDSTTSDDRGEYTFTGLDSGVIHNVFVDSASEGKNGFNFVANIVPVGSVASAFILGTDATWLMEHEAGGGHKAIVSAGEIEASSTFKTDADTLKLRPKAGTFSDDLIIDADGTNIKISASVNLLLETRMELGSSSYFIDLDGDATLKDVTVDSLSIAGNINADNFSADDGGTGQGTIIAGVIDGSNAVTQLDIKGDVVRFLESGSSVTIKLSKSTIIHGGGSSNEAILSDFGNITSLGTIQGVGIKGSAVTVLAGGSITFAGSAFTMLDDGAGEISISSSSASNLIFELDNTGAGDFDLVVGGDIKATTINTAGATLAITATSILNETQVIKAASPSLGITDSSDDFTTTVINKNMSVSTLKAGLTTGVDEELFIEVGADGGSGNVSDLSRKFLRAYNSFDTPGGLVLHGVDDTAYSLWVDSSGNLRIKSGGVLDATNFDSEGVIVGTQS